MRNTGGKLLTSQGAKNQEGVSESLARKIGYARVSTDEQSLALQLDALHAEGCARVFQDTASGARADRKGLADAVAACAPGDVLVVWKLDRLGRSLLDLVGLVETLKSRDVGLKLLEGAGAAIDTTTAIGKLTFGVAALFAEFERELIRERTLAGMKAARRRGKKMGRPL
jgi:DNA invertase Pin-like site-specific DNA recombinase